MTVKRERCLRITTHIINFNCDTHSLPPPTLSPRSPADPHPFVIQPPPKRHNTFAISPISRSILPLVHMFGFRGMFWVVLVAVIVCVLLHGASEVGAIETGVGITYYSECVCNGGCATTDDSGQDFITNCQQEGLSSACKASDTTCSDSCQAACTACYDTGSTINGKCTPVPTGQTSGCYCNPDQTSCPASQAPVPLKGSCKNISP